MNKKILLIIVLLVCVVAGFFIFNFAGAQNYVNVNNAEFMVPEGYQVIDQNYSVNLTKGDNFICIKKNISANNIKDAINDYIKAKEDKNHTTNLSNFTVNNTLVYKVTVDGSHIVHYWFEKDGNIQELYTRTSEADTDKLISDMITSMK
ncbi:hypothetical protein [Methanobrevibacter sp.]|uniref:hypothetical protein n=1 Tax=Methanobrevibacter sp. TaxID=66852 RepID=UPI00386B611E